MLNMKVVKKLGDQKYLMWYNLKKDKKNNTDLALECHITESLGRVLIMFSSVNNKDLPSVPGNLRVECSQSFYEIESVEIKVRRSSSTTDELESEEELIENYPSTHSQCLNDRNKVSKLNLFFKMKLEMARCFVDDLSEETSILKESLVALKKIAENFNFHGIVFNS